MKNAPGIDDVAAIARRLLDDGYVRYEVDAWLTAAHLVVAYDRLSQESDGAAILGDAT